MKKFICSVCGKEYTEKELDKYIECVNFCAGSLKKEQDRIRAEYLNNMNSALNRVKAAEEYYKEQLRLFMNEYPEEYKKNFDTDYKKNNQKNECCIQGNDDDDCDDWLTGFDQNVFSNMKTLEFSSVTDKNGDSKTNVKLNGKDVKDDKVLEELKNNPDTRYIAKLLEIMSE